MVRSIAGVVAMASLFAGSANAVYQIDTTEQIKQSARTLAYDLMLFYNGNKTGEIPGILPGPPAENKGPYYWWQGGAMMGAYMDYWHYTGDDSYNQVVMQGMLHQVGEDKNYMPQNHTRSLGNDDQAFWGMSAMLAAENKFPDPPKDKPQWLALAQAVWNTQADPQRHDATCGGGLRWQIPAFNSGYDYKNTISNACFMNMGARLARYTGNATYAKYASETWDWIWEKQYIDHKSWLVYDGAKIQDNCTDINKLTFSYNNAVLLQGAAFMYNFTEEAKWKDRVDNLLSILIKNFFPDNIAYEVACETSKTCTPDMLSFKGYVHRWMAQVTQLAPHTRDKIMTVLRTSTQAAVKQCTGGASGRQCGFYWSSGQFVDPASDKTSGAGEAMDVMSAVATLLVDGAPAPVTKDTGGTSKGDVNAGNPGHDNDRRNARPITTGDRAGAGFLTILLIAFGVSVFAWISIID